MQIYRLGAVWDAEDQDCIAFAQQVQGLLPDQEPDLEDEQTIYLWEAGLPIADPT